MKLSVAMCTYNGARYVEEQLKSIAAQTRRPDELIVCDDCSADETIAIVRSFAARSPFPVYVHENGARLGSTKNFERAIGYSQGEIIALSDQDDSWEARKLELFERVFDTRPECGLIFTDAALVDENLRPLGTNLWTSVGFDGRKQALVIQGKAFRVLLDKNMVTGATMAFRGEFKPLILPIPENLAIIHDGWIALLISAVAEVALIAEPLIKYRQHEQQQIGARKEINENGPSTQLEAIQAAMDRSNPYAEIIDIAQTVKSRLSAAGAAFKLGPALSDLERRLTHWQARANLPPARLRRLSTVLKELLTMRYHHCSNGIHSAAKDLLMPAAPRQ